MIDPVLRKKLSQDLRSLVTGRITNEDFDDAYAEHYYNAQDRTVAEIADFGYGLYSDSHRYRLKGRYAVSSETRRIAARCILFLCSKDEYDWPRWPFSTDRVRLMEFVVWQGQTLGFALAICFLLMLSLEGSREIAYVWPLVVFWPFGVFGLVSFPFSIWYLYFGGRQVILRRSAGWHAWLRHGNHDVWPFRWREDFYEARRKPCFLAGSLGASRRQ